MYLIYATKNSLGNKITGKNCNDTMALLENECIGINTNFSLVKPK